MVFITACDSPVGTLTLASDGEALSGLWLAGQKHFMATVREGYARDGALPVFDAARAWLARYFAGERPMPGELALAFAGTAFQRAVWLELLAVPYGETTTYGRLAARLSARGLRAGARAVGGAVGRNPISIVVPCHRVVGADGALTGYAGGLEAKRFLLRLEGARL